MIHIILLQTNFKSEMIKETGFTKHSHVLAIINTRKMNRELEMNGISVSTLLFSNVRHIRQSLPSPGY